MRPPLPLPGRLGLALLLSACGAPGCGARTGLGLPDAPPSDRQDAAVVDAPDVGELLDAPDAFDAPEALDVVDAPDIVDAYDAPDVCTTRRYALAPQPAEALLVLDRSRSMNTALEGTTRRAALLSALRASLPGFAGRITMGSMHMPSAALNCDVALPLAAPLGSTPDAIIARFDASGLGSGTPTAAAIDLARDHLLSRTGERVSRSIVLATDGAPGCNTSLNPATCTCLEAMTTCTVRNCLDDVRTIGSITRAADAGIAVYVIGIDDPTQPSLLATLDRMAVAGGRPRAVGAGLPRYYSVRRSADLTEALEAVRRSLTACVLRYPGTPEEAARAQVFVGDVLRPNDPTHTNGWDWTTDARLEIALYGSACMSASADTPTRIEVPCLDR